jgi:iron complex outermembrane receptor protein
MKIFNQSKINRAVVLGSVLTSLVGTTALAQEVRESVLKANTAAEKETKKKGRYDIEVISVTSRKLEEQLQDAPIAVSAFTGAELDERGAIDVTDVAASSPNVHFQTGGATSGMSAAPTVFIRGIGQSDFNVNSDPAVGMYIDGIYLGRMVGSMTDLMDLERAEVLRGPQGTLFGRNSIGGAINLITNKPDPDDDLEGDIMLTLGERNYRYLKGSVHIPLSDSVAARFSGFTRERDGYVDAVQYDDFQLGGEDVWGVRGALRFDISDELSLDITADGSERRDPPAAVVATQLGNVSRNPSEGGNAGWVDWINGGNVGAPPSGSDRSTMPSGWRFNTGFSTPAGNGAGTPPPPNAAWITPDLATCSGTSAQINSSLNCYGNAHILGDNKVNSAWYDKEGNKIEPEQALDVGGISAVINWETPLGQLTATSAYREMEASFNNDNDFTPFIIFHNINDKFTQDQFSQEIQLAGDLTDNVKYISGVYYFKENGLQRIALLAPLLPPAGAPPAAAHLPLFQTNDRVVENISKAVYGQVIYDITESVHLTAGARYTKNDKFIDLTLARPDSESPWFTANDSAEATISETNTLLNLSWNINSDVMVYGQMTNGFRDGGWPARFPGLPSGLPELDDVAFAPEQVDAFELGIKSSWLDGNLRINAAVFTTSYEDIQIEFSDPELNGAPNTSNLGEATISGLEAEINYVVTDNLRFDLALGFLDAGLDSIEGGSLNSGADNTSTTLTTANQMPYTPDWQIGLGINYSIDLSDGAYIRSRVDVNYTDDQFYTIENSPNNFQEAYTTVNANMTYVTAEEDWELTLGVKNLTDESYATTSRTSADAGSISRSISRPREVYLQARYLFY